MEKRRIYKLSDEELLTLGSIIEHEKKCGYLLINVDVVTNLFATRLSPSIRQFKTNVFTFKPISEED